MRLPRWTSSAALITVGAAACLGRALAQDAPPEAAAAEPAPEQSPPTAASLAESAAQPKTYRRSGSYNELLDAVPTFIGIEPREIFDKDHLLKTHAANESSADQRQAG